MQTVIIVIHLMVVVAMVGLVLLQRSEGGGLGIGGGGGFMTSRGTANVLTRATAILAGLFFVTSLILSILAGARPQAALDHQQQRAAESAVPGASGRQPARPVERRRGRAAAAGRPAPPQSK